MMFSRIRAWRNKDEINHIKSKIFHTQERRTESEEEFNNGKITDEQYDYERQTFFSKLSMYKAVLHKLGCRDY